MNVLWAWIASGVLHKDSCSVVKELNVYGLFGIRDMAIVTRILTSTHPGRELVMAITRDLKASIESCEMPLPVDKRLFVSKTRLRKKPSSESPDEFHELSRSITEAMQWEVLVQLNNGWVCILAPAYGVVWAPSDSILAQHERNSSVISGSSAPSNTSLKAFDWSLAYHESVNNLIPMAGHSLESLRIQEMDSMALPVETVELILLSRRW